MKKSIILIVILNVIGHLSMAQQDPHFTQYMFAKSYWSPALTALDGKGSVSVLSRSQWLGYEPTIDQDGGAPSTQFLNFSLPFSFKNLPLGVGDNVIYDVQGQQNDVGAQVSLAYHRNLNRGVLSFGIRPEIINRTIDFSKLRFATPEPNFPAQKESQSAFDLAFGMSYSTDGYILAASVNHILRPELNYNRDGSSSADNRKSLNYSLYGEYNYRLTYNIDLTPSVLVTSDLNAYSIDLSAIATYNKKLWAGLSYRNNEAMALLIGYSFLDGNQLKAGYSFDYVIKEQSAKQATSHEIFIRYDLPSISTGAKKIIRTPRFRY